MVILLIIVDPWCCQKRIHRSFVSFWIIHCCVCVCDVCACVVCWCPVFYCCGFFLSGVIAFFLLLFFFLVMRRQLFLLLRLLLLQFLSTLLPLVECQNSSSIAPIADTVFIPPYNYTQCQESDTFRILDAQRSFNASTNLYSLNVTGRSLISVANLSSTGTCNKRNI